MNASTIAANPFALMIQPEEVLHAMESSAALRGLSQQQFRPLDREVPDALLAAEAAAKAGATPFEFVPTQFERDLVLPTRSGATRAHLSH